MSTKNNFKEILMKDHNSFIERGYEVVKKIIFDPANSIFSGEKNRRSFVEVHYCNQCKNCEAYKNNKCLCHEISLSLTRCPFRKFYYLEGVTKRSKQYYNFIESAKEVFNANDNKFTVRLSPLRETMKIGDGSFVFINLPHLKNYVNSIDEELNIKEEHLIKTELFTKETILKLLEFRPEALFGGEITTYQKNDIPSFVRELRINFPELYAECVVGTKYECLEDRFAYLERKAYLNSLNPGKVKIDERQWNWDGKTLTGPGTNISFSLGKGNITITPPEDTIATIIDNVTVDKNKIKLV